MIPFYEKIESSPVEKKFIQYLDELKNVKWWFKNGERDANASFFAIPYEKNLKEYLFYIDFLVQFDGKLGFFETKALQGKGSAQESEEKVKALKKYLDLRGNKFLGGIVVLENEAWKIYNEKGQKYDVENKDNWTPLSEYLSFNL